MRPAILLASLLAAALVIPAGGASAQDPRTPADGESLTVSPHTEELITRHFATCDHDGNGWVSFREARESLRFDRGKFQYHDPDRDGRIRPGEYRAYFLDTLGRSGSVVPPMPATGATLPPERTPEQLRSAYDITSDGSLDLREITQLLQDYQRTDLPPQQALVALDRDSSGQLEMDEIPGLLGVLGRPGADAGAEAGPTPTSILELFGAALERDLGTGSAPHPNQIIGPVPPFHRLDVDGDGLVSASDLERLQRPLQLPVRLHAVLATLDLDGDGALSRSEFRSALGVSSSD